MGTWSWDAFDELFADCYIDIHYAAGDFWGSAVWSDANGDDIEVRVDRSAAEGLNFEEFMERLYVLAALKAREQG